MAVALGIAACGSPRTTPGDVGVPEPPADAAPEPPADSEPAADAADPPPANAADALLGLRRDATFDRLLARIAGVQIVSAAGLDRLGLTWEESVARVRARFLAARTAEDVFYALLSLRNGLHDQHTRLEFSPPASDRVAPPAAPDVFLPWRIRPESVDASSTDYVIQAVSPAWDDVVPGSRVVAVNGVAMADLEQELVEWFPGSSPDGLHLFVARSLSHRSPAEMPSPRAGDAVTLDVVPPGERSARSVTTAWSAEYWNPPGSDPCIARVDMGPARDFLERAPEFVGINLCVYPTADPTRKVVRWFSFFYEFRDFSGGDPGLAYAPMALRERMSVMSYAIADADLPYLPGERAPHGLLDPGKMGVIEMEALGAWFRGQGVRSVLIDVRENGGGNFDPAWAGFLASDVFHQPAMQVLFGRGLRDEPALLERAEAGPQAAMARAYLRDHPEAERSPLYPFICRSQACGEADLDVPAAAQPWGVDAVLLTGPDCASACDTYAVTLQDNGLARVAGLPSEGADSPVRVPVDLVLADGQSVVTLVVTVGVSYRADGTPVQGHPPTPSCVVPPTAANRGGYLEAVLEACP